MLALPETRGRLCTLRTIVMEKAAVSTSLENAPLVELIAEVRWDPVLPAGGQSLSGGLGPTFITPTTVVDEFFMRFGRAIHASYSEVERLVPSGFPIAVHQPVYRFKDREVGSTSSLYQIGPGLFTANAVPPYESWARFSPLVRAGVEAMLSTRSADERERPFIATNLRYIDAFGPGHTEGRDVNRFLAEVLGLELSVPPALSQHIVPGSAPKPAVQLQIPMTNGMLMSVGVGEGTANGKPAIMMDTSVGTTLPVMPTVEAAMQAFELAHKAIDESFRMLIEPIKHLMPEKIGVAK